MVRIGEPTEFSTERPPRWPGAAHPSAGAVRSEARPAARGSSRDL